MVHGSGSLRPALLADQQQLPLKVWAGEFFAARLYFAICVVIFKSSLKLSTDFVNGGILGWHKSHSFH